MRKFPKNLEIRSLYLPYVAKVSVSCHIRLLHLASTKITINAIDDVEPPVRAYRGTLLVSDRRILSILQLFEKLNESCRSRPFSADGRSFPVCLLKVCWRHFIFLTRCWCPEHVWIPYDGGASRINLLCLSVKVMINISLEIRIDVMKHEIHEKEATHKQHSLCSHSQERFANEITSYHDFIYTEIQTFLSSFSNFNHHNNLNDAKRIHYHLVSNCPPPQRQQVGLDRRVRCIGLETLRLQPPQ